GVWQTSGPGLESSLTAFVQWSVSLIDVQSVVAMHSLRQKWSASRPFFEQYEPSGHVSGPLAMHGSTHWWRERSTVPHLVPAEQPCVASHGLPSAARICMSVGLSLPQAASASTATMLRIRMAAT